jgi:UDP-N-acetylmuramoyl-L-alanyl-D-glutamate--2,6-diaminopimelate ligase
VDSKLLDNITGLATDSRRVKKGDLFFALQGGSVDGAKYIEQALTNGALRVLSETVHPAANKVDNLRKKVGEIASIYYHNPSAELKVAAVTGTDGKSSVTHFIVNALEEIGEKASVVGTLTHTHTTPPPIELQEFIRKIVDDNVVSVAIEASSHGIEQSRLSGIEIDTAVLTNAGRDHLDYHNSIEEYHAVKRSLFYLGGIKSVVVNLADRLGRDIFLNPPPNRDLFGYVVSASSELQSTILAEILDSDYFNPITIINGTVVAQNGDGMELEVECIVGDNKLNGKLSTPLYGSFNAENLLAALGVLLSWNISFKNGLSALSRVAPVAGRVELFSGGELSPDIIVDYAHTANALSLVLETLRKHLQNSAAKLWVVFGCGGERDRGKRVEMGNAAELGADYIVLTNDNPRREDPKAIIDEIMQGISVAEREKSCTLKVIESREEAIKFAFNSASVADTILVAGKGHEQWQYVGDDKVRWSDRDFAQELIRRA